MRIVVTGDGPDLDAPLSTNFARCPFFLVVEAEDLSYDAVANPWATAQGGAGPEAAKMVAEIGVQAVITGLVGPNAFFALQQAGIQVFVACGGSARSAVNAYRAAHLPPLLKPNSRPHSPFSSHVAGHGSPGKERPAGGKRRQSAKPVNPGLGNEGAAELLAYIRAMEAELTALKAQVQELQGRWPVASQSHGDRSPQEQQG